MDVFEAICGRRSVRKFSSAAVKEEDLFTILAAARMAPSGGNLQPWRFTVIRNRSVAREMAAVISEKADALAGLGKLFPRHEPMLQALRAKCARSSLFFSQAPVTIAVQAGGSQNEPAVQYLCERGLSLHEAHRMMGHVEIQSASAAIENLLLAAHALGYGTCWMHVPFFALKDLERILKVREPWRLIALVPLGVPDRSHPAEAPARKELDQLVEFID